MCHVFSFLFYFLFYFFRVLIIFIIFRFFLNYRFLNFFIIFNSFICFSFFSYCWFVSFFFCFFFKIVLWKEIIIIICRITCVLIIINFSYKLAIIIINLIFMYCFWLDYNMYGISCNFYNLNDHQQPKMEMQNWKWLLE